MYDCVGLASRSNGFADLDIAVRFDIPYGESPYHIALLPLDLERMAYRFRRNNERFSGLDYRIELEPPDLPLMVGVNKVNFANAGEMQVHVATMSEVYKHIGRLTVHRNYRGEWSKVGYEEIKLKQLPDTGWI
jgi:hypothetical protein